MRLVAILSIFIVFTFQAFAQSNQSDSAAIAQIIADVFDGMRQSDSSMIGKHMHQEVRMQTVSKTENGNTITQLNSADGWLKAVTGNTGAIWDERIDNLRIQVDGTLASAWMDFAFYLGDKFSHCGSNSFQFIKINENWKIIYIIDSRMREDCNRIEN